MGLQDLEPPLAYGKDAYPAGSTAITQFAPADWQKAPFWLSLDKSGQPGFVGDVVAERNKRLRRACAGGTKERSASGSGIDDPSART
jgi:hypothetical protein